MSDYSEHMRYIGVCALLGRVAAKVTDEEDRAAISRALQDCVDASGGTLKVSRNGRGWAVDIVWGKK
jgi:hypothetical protein